MTQPKPTLIIRIKTLVENSNQALKNLRWVLLAAYVIFLFILFSPLFNPSDSASRFVEDNRESLMKPGERSILINSYLQEVGDFLNKYDLTRRNFRFSGSDSAFRGINLDSALISITRNNPAYTKRISFDKDEYKESSLIFLESVSLGFKIKEGVIGRYLDSFYRNEGKGYKEFSNYDKLEIIQARLPEISESPEIIDVEILRENYGVRYDLLVLNLGISAFIFSLLFYVNSGNSSSVKTNTSLAKENPAREGSLEYLDFLNYDLLIAEQKAEELFSRSTLMLVSGLIMAFIGIGVFYFSLPDYSPNTSRDYIDLIRPIGMLIFVESVAWFLLRQYRVLINDYKGFHRLFLKRLNYNIAIRMLQKKDITDKELMLATTLLQEDLSGRLQTGETTQSIEERKMIEANLVPDLMRILLDREKGN